jgi:hypothetical protein
MKTKTTFSKLMGLCALVLMLGFAQQASAAYGVVQSQTDLIDLQGYGLGTKNQMLLKLTVTPNGVTAGDIINSFTFDITGSAEISKITVLRASFLDLNNRFGTAVDNPGASVTISGGYTFTSATSAQTLWVVVNIKPTATLGAVLDVNCSNANVTVSGVVNNTVPAAPTSNKTAKVSANMTGTKTIKAGGDYATLNDAVKAFNCAGVQPDVLGTGGVTFILEDANYVGNSATTGGGFGTTSNLVRQTGTALNPIVFKGKGIAGVRPKVTTTNTSGTSDACFGGYGVDYMTVDSIEFIANGVTAGTGGGNRFEYGILFVAVYDDGCWSNEVKNCKIDMGNLVSNNRGAGVMILARDGMVGQIAAGANNFNKIHDNIISNVAGGVCINATQPSTAPLVWDSNNEIYNNVITGNFGTEQGGIGIGYCKDTKIYNNTLDGSGSTVAMNAAVTAIQGTYYRNYGTIECYNNVIKNVTNAGTGTVSANATVIGINVIADVVKIYNNVVTNLKAESATVNTGGTSTGITLKAGGTTYTPAYSVWNNSVNLAQITPAGGTKTAALELNGGGSDLITVNLVNNIFVNNSTGGGTNVSTGGTNNFVVYSSLLSTSRIDATSDNNLYYPESASMFVFDPAKAIYPTLASFKAAMLATTNEQNSVTGDPKFTGVSDLTITDVFSTANNTGKVLASVTTDRVGNARSEFKPDMGAYEFDRYITSISKPNETSAKIYSLNGQIMIDLSTIKETTIISIIDTKGAVIKSLNSNGSELVSIALANKGIYLVRIQNSVKKVVLL